MKKYIIMVLLAVCFNINGQENNMEGKFTIWSTIHRNRLDGNETDEVVIEDVDFIKQSSPKIKTIIAYYSGCLGENIILANALGNFSSLNAAREVLLKNKEHYFKNLPKRMGEFPGILKIDVEEKFITVILSGVWGSHIGKDVFKIKKNGDIEYQK